MSNQMSKFTRAMQTLHGSKIAAVVANEEQALGRLWTSSDYRALPLKGRYIKLVELVDEKIAMSQAQRQLAADLPRSECAEGCSSCCSSHHILLSHLEAQVLVGTVDQLPAD